MNDFEIIKLMNEATIVYLKKKNEPSSQNEKIQQLFESDEALFFKIDKEKALNILKTVGVQESQLEEEYSKLTSQKEFYRLRDKGVTIDDSFVIKYNLYDSNNIFNNKDEEQVNESTELVDTKVTQKNSFFKNIIQAIKRFFSKR